jgi:hypothetical protein
MYNLHGKLNTNWDIGSNKLNAVRTEYDGILLTSNELFHLGY